MPRAPQTRVACGQCVFWEKTRERRFDEGYQAEGLCRRRAPVAVPSRDINYDGRTLGGDEGLFTAWPRTFEESDWCAEGEVRPDFGGRYPEDS